jgi:cytochrome c-type biogenesis protein CcmH/NrfG
MKVVIFVRNVLVLLLMAPGVMLIGFNVGSLAGDLIKRQLNKPPQQHRQQIQHLINQLQAQPQSAVDWI